MVSQEQFTKLETSIGSLSYDLIYSKKTTLYIYLCLLMRKLSLEKSKKNTIDWEGILNGLSEDRVQAFYKALDTLKAVEGLAFLSELEIQAVGEGEVNEEAENRTEILLNAIIPPINEIKAFDQEAIHELFQSVSRVLRESSDEASGEFILNDFFYDLLFDMMPLKKGNSVYVFGLLDRNFIVELLYRHLDIALSLYAQIEDKTDYLITKILFYLLGADSGNITHADFITHPITEDNGYDLKKFDYVVSTSLVFKQKIDGKRIVMEDQHNRFSRSALVMAREFYHWAVIDTGLASLNENGTFFDLVPGGPLTVSTSANARRNLIEDRVACKVFQFNSPAFFHMRFPILLATFKKSEAP